MHKVVILSDEEYYCCLELNDEQFKLLKRLSRLGWIDGDVYYDWSELPFQSV